MWIDTHCHLEAKEFTDREKQITLEANLLGVCQIIIPSVNRQSFSRVSTLAHENHNCSYALGIHPLAVPNSTEKDLAILEKALEKGLSDPRLVGIGEIGLDFYLPELTESPLREKQEYFLTEQLKMAKKSELPVLLHTRRSLDTVLKYLRRHQINLGIAHAFNGSIQQAHAFIDLGFMLSFCGTVTYDRANQLKKLATELPLNTFVLETDSPDLPPAWINKKENSPIQLPRIGEFIAKLRGILPEELARKTSQNAAKAIPRLSSLLEKE